MQLAARLVENRGARGIRNRPAIDPHNNWDELFASTPQGVNDQNKIPGFYNILDFNADGVIDDLDAAPYGYSNIPQNTYNLSLGASYKGFSASLQFYGVSNVSRKVDLENFPVNYTLNTVFGHVLDYWSKENTNASSYLPRWKTPNSEFIGNYNIYDASYIRLKTAEIAYNLPPRAVKRLGMLSIEKRALNVILFASILSLNLLT